MRVIIYPYKMGSKSSKELSKSLREVGRKTLRVFPNRLYKPKRTDVIINWGNSEVPTWARGSMKILNRFDAIAKASNKIKSFKAFSEAGVPTVEWTEDKSIAEEWLQEEKVFARTTIISHSGRGIVVANPGEVLVDAPLYTKAFKKGKEFRVHVFDGEILDIQEKRKRSNTGNRSDFDVWNHGNNFVFAREDVNPPIAVKEAAVEAVAALGLDFGAVDVGYSVRNDVAAVFEVNTSPGIEGITLNKYVEKFYAYV